MPIGLVIMSWNDRSGSKIEAKYPESASLSLTDKTLMEIVSTHEYSGESGMVTLVVGTLNIASYYTGSEKPYYIVLLLTPEEDPDLYEGCLMDIAQVVLKNILDEAYKQMVPSFFQRLSVYPTLSEEQLLATTYTNEIKRRILNRLREEGVIQKSELIIWLKDVYKGEFFDMEAILIDLIKREIIKEVSVKGMPSEVIFLIKDIWITRIPAVKIISNPSECGLPEPFVKNYIVESKNFFKDYHPSEEDNLMVLEILIDPEVYEVLRLLRISVATKDTLQKLKKKGVEDIESAIRKLSDARMINIYKGEKGIEYYTLISDFYLKTAFPKYMLNIIKDGYANKSKSEKVLIEYLSILKDTYYTMKS
jgi:hypothetical protein